jgi:hypothetical protein
LDCLRWAREHGCPWNIGECLSLAKDKKNTKIYNWIKCIYIRNSKWFF